MKVFSEFTWIMSLYLEVCALYETEPQVWPAIDVWKPELHPDNPQYVLLFNEVATLKVLGSKVILETTEV